MKRSIFGRKKSMSRGKICSAAQSQFCFFLSVIGFAFWVNSVTVQAQNTNVFSGWGKYDFTPGDTVIFYDDFSADEIGAFPEIWDLTSGECQVIEANNRSWLVALENSEVDAYLESPLPSAFAVEFEANILRGGKPGHWQVTFLDASQQQCTLTFDSQFANFMTHSGAAYSAEHAIDGIRRIAILFEDGRFRCYLDKLRLFEAAAGTFKPTAVRVGMFAGTASGEQRARFTDFRITGKSKTPQRLLYENGKWVCYGIYFTFGEAKFRGQSYATLQHIGELLQKDPTLNLRIEDHTNDKEDPSDNARLSQLRAEAIRDYLLDEFHFAKDRLQVLLKI